MVGEGHQKHKYSNNYSSNQSFLLVKFLNVAIVIFHLDVISAVVGISTSGFIDNIFCYFLRIDFMTDVKIQHMHKYILMIHMMI